jgi:hypothetical protein
MSDIEIYRQVWELQRRRLVSNRVDRNDTPSALGHIIDSCSRCLLFSLLALHSPTFTAPTSDCCKFASRSHASSAFIRCSGGLDFKLDNASGDWSVVQDHPPCDVSGSALPAVKATAIEMARVYRRPLVAFRVLPSGLIRDISLLYSSGSASLDRRALAQLARIRYPRHNCCSCRVSTAIDVDFEGPVWVRDSQDLQFLPSGKHFLRHYDDRSVNE